MQNVLIIKTDGTMSIAETDLTDGLEFLQGVVGGWVQVVGLPAESNETESVALWLNEEGKFSGLEYNSLASYLWERSYGMTDVIMGDVVLTGGADEDGESVGLSDAQLSDLTNLLAPVGTLVR